ncbi:Flagellar hook-length control protein FliK [Clostridium vincentii]|uniref:Flagellar hook-length control protein FliK n=2 Tax=Clostridium vincentii TaxID=52704 RepID=A0A2T0BJA6_9CLOT|nr:Flagellar hook-length control protein FliK [Clostridium vincentii]
MASAKTNTQDQNINTQSSMNQEDAVKVINNLLSDLETGKENESLNQENLTTIQGLLNKLGVKLDREVGSKDDSVRSLAGIVEVVNKMASAKTNTQDQNINTQSSMNQEDAVKVINNLLSDLETGKENESLNQENLTTIQGLLNKLSVKLDREVGSKDDSVSFLAGIVELVNKMASAKTNTQEQDVNVEVSTLKAETLNLQINDLVTDKLILTKVSTSLNQTSNTQSSINQEDTVNVINNLLSVLETGEDDGLLNKESLTTIEGLLNKLGVKLDEEVGTKEIKTYDILRGLVKDVSQDVKNLVEAKTSKETLQNNILAKGLTLKEETPRYNNADVTLNKVVNEANYVKETLADRSFSDGGKESNQNNSRTLNEEISKETKLLSSILDDGDEKENNKFSLIVDRLGTQTTKQIMPEPTVINKESIATDVIKNVKLMVTNNIKELTVKINPGQLGEITIKIIEEGGVMKANLKASSRETYHLLSQQLGDIKKNLGEQNIKIQEVNVSIYEEDATFYKDGQFSSNSFQNDANNRQNKGTEFTGEFTEDELKDNNELNEEGNINMLA